MNTQWVHLDIDEIVRETDKAFLVDIDGERYWIPFSQIADYEDYSEGDENCVMSVTEWIANEKGLS